MQQIVDTENAPASGTFQKQMQQIGGGERIIERPVTGPMRETETIGKGAEFAIRYLVTHQATRQCDRVDHGGRERLVVAPVACSRNETDVETGVVRHHDRVTDELEQAW